MLTAKAAWHFIILRFLEVTFLKLPKQIFHYLLYYAMRVTSLRDPFLRYSARATKLLSKKMSQRRHGVGNSVSDLTSPCISLLPKLPLFAPQCIGIANQMTICFVARSERIFFCSNGFFNLMVPPKYFFLTIRATLSRFRPQRSAADEMIADLNSNHFFSMSSDTSRNCLNLDDILY